jgi:hypothetical protein
MAQGGTLSLNKSLRTNKVALDPGNVAQSFRLFVSNPTADIPNYLVDIYGRPAAIDAGLQFEGTQASGIISPLYRIEVENNISRPQYNEYLNVPQGLMMTQSEYPNRPLTDMLGVNRDRAFMMDGTYATMPYPTKATNPNSDADFMAQQAWNANQLQTQYDNRLWLNSVDTQSGF